MVSQEPEIMMRLRGISVVFKPPRWEVDAKGKLSSSGLYLSDYMAVAHGPNISAVLARSEFEYGFIHRLDVPSSGLILAGTSFHGYTSLQWQIHTYTIGREYAVLLNFVVPEALRDINAPIHDYLPGHSFVDDRGRLAETHLKLAFHVRRKNLRNMEHFGLVSIAIHTGRRHQIRVHCQHAGHPTAVDEKYSHLSVAVCSRGLEFQVGSK